MEAPEKIYLERILCSNEVYDNWKSQKTISDDIEYTRTDAFIEKACVKLKKLMYDNLMFQGRLHREEVIDNFVGNFKSYVKGE